MFKKAILTLIVTFVTIYLFYKLEYSNTSNVALPTPTVNSTNNSKTTTNTNDTTQPGFTLGDVAKHNSQNDCYIVINSNIYNVTSFLNSHPGGSKRIIENCGHEVSGVFASIHSNRAWNLLSGYLIGKIGSQINQPDQSVGVSNAIITTAMPRTNFNGDDFDDD